MFMKFSGEFCSKISGTWNGLMWMDEEVSVQIAVDLQPMGYSVITCHEGFPSLHCEYHCVQQSNKLFCSCSLLDRFLMPADTSICAHYLSCNDKSCNNV